ncbi:MAG TPA: hypothetical protein VGM01_14490 [Ktedonobacteraceae bacterium]|jgi:hypothetical protein
MDQRIYYGNINPNALADYLVGTFQQPFYYQQQHTRAQKIVQGERIYVQIMRNSDWGSTGRKAISVNISRIGGGISVEMGASDWLDIDEAGLAGMLLGVLFFPPLLLIPLIQGLSGSGFSHDVWNVIDTYCMQASGGQSYRPHAPHGFYCTYCGAFNQPGWPNCHSCHASFNFAPPQPASAPSAPVTSEPAPPAPQPQAESSSQRAKSETRPMFALMICPNCKATVVPAHFCGNCAAPLPDVGVEERAGE